MKLGTVLKLRTRLLRRRNRHQALYAAQPFAENNLGRARLDGRVEEADHVLDQLDRLIKNVQDRWHDRRKKAS